MPEYQPIPQTETEIESKPTENLPGIISNYIINLQIKISNFFSGFFEYFFSLARTFNSVANGAISGDAAKNNIPLLILGLLTGTINSYAAGEARQTEKIAQVGWGLWSSDRLISLIYGLGCGATTAASAYLMLKTISISLFGIYGLVGFAVLLGFITFIASRPKLGNYKALALSLLVASLFAGISMALISFNVVLLPTIILSSTYLLCAVMGFCTTILNYGITQNSIISLIKGIVDHYQQKKIDPKNLKITRRQKANYSFLLTIAVISCLASGLAIGGLTYISIMALPAAFGFVMPFAPLLAIAVSISAISTSAMVPLLIKQCLPIVDEWSKLALKDLPENIKKQVKKLFIFDKQLYADTPTNKIKFYFKGALIMLMVPIAITGTVLTMVQATSALAEVISNFIKFLPLKMKPEQVVAQELAEDTAATVLGLALFSDLTFSLSTVLPWISRAFKLQEVVAKPAHVPIPSTAIGSANVTGISTLTSGQAAINEEEEEEEEETATLIQRGEVGTAGAEAPVVIDALTPPRSASAANANNKHSLWATRQTGHRERSASAIPCYPINTSARRKSLQLNGDPTPGDNVVTHPKLERSQSAFLMPVT